MGHSKYLILILLVVAFIAAFWMHGRSVFKGLTK